MKGIFYITKIFLSDNLKQYNNPPNNAFTSQTLRSLLLHQ